MFEEIQYQRLYKIAMVSYLAKGGGDFSVIKDKKMKHHVTGTIFRYNDSVIMLQVAPLGTIYVH